MSETTTTITAQVPIPLRDEIGQIAAKEHRSASGQIRMFLESAIAEYRQRSGSQSPSPVPTARRGRGGRLS